MLHVDWVVNYIHVDWVVNYIHADILGYLRIPYKYEQARVVFMK